MFANGVWVSEKALATRVPGLPVREAMVAVAKIVGETLPEAAGSK